MKDNDEHASQRLYESLSFSPEAQYLSRSDYQKDVDHPAYRTDPTFRDMVAVKLTNSRHLYAGTAAPDTGHAQVEVRMGVTGPDANKMQATEGFDADGVRIDTGETGHPRITVLKGGKMPVVTDAGSASDRTYRHGATPQPIVADVKPEPGSAIVWPNNDHLMIKMDI